MDIVVTEIDRGGYRGQRNERDNRGGYRGDRNDRQDRGGFREERRDDQQGELQKRSAIQRW